MRCWSRTCGGGRRRSIIIIVIIVITDITDIAVTIYCAVLARGHGRNVQSRRWIVVGVGHEGSCM